MKRILLLLLIIFVFFVANANAQLYTCVDRKGNPIITGAPSPEMKDCELKDSSKGSDVNCPGCSEEKKQYIRHLRDECNKPMASKSKCDAYRAHLGIGNTSKKQRRLEDMEDEVQRHERNRKRNEEYSYESSTGQRYEYDLSNPADRARYRVDPAAQARDRVNPRIQLDRNIGQYGGGAE